MPSRNKIFKAAGVILLFTIAFFGGRLAAARFAPADSARIVPAPENWGLGFQEDGKLPTGNATIDELKKYDAYYAEDTQEKVLYLTFDCGYENGNIEPMLDALKKHKAPATFFVVGNFLSTSPDIVKRINKEGHTVCLLYTSDAADD